MIIWMFDFAKHMQSFKVKCLTCYLSMNKFNQRCLSRTHPLAGFILLTIQQLKQYRCISVLVVSYCKQGCQRMHEFHISSTPYSFYMYTILKGDFCPLVSIRFQSCLISNVRGRKNSTYILLRIPLIACYNHLSDQVTFRT